ncbi:DegT/DnrJ/EryC1/StrS aminotransferase family protein [Candidatus Dojkabacteria bacterium]|nr:DegT/DnrJ/EryC1/StrS aminotransferase family protein [Candidatus Dojkabacteria bacterium]
MFIPIAEPIIGREELDLVTKTLKSGWISSIGENISKFEETFSKYCGAKYGVATSNGTAALHLCLVSAGIGPGDEVIVPSMTFIATANAVVYTGAKPIFVDSEIETGNIDPDKIESKINKNTKAIIAVHLYGHPANMGLVRFIAHKHKLLVFEDAAEAHGAKYKGKTVGGLSNASCFSFYGNKIITTGEGGMIVTNNKAFANKARALRDHGVSLKRKYYYPWLGFNYRMTNIQAAIGLAQFNKIDEIIERKREISKIYRKYLATLVPRITLSNEAEWARSVFWMNSILVPPKGKVNRDFLISELKKQGIDSRPFFFPIHKYSRFGKPEKLPVAEYLARTGINLPSSSNLNEDTIKYICNNIINILQSN